MFEEITKQYEKLRKFYPEFRRDWLTSTKLDFGTGCFALGFTTKDIGGMVGKFQGFKSPNMLIVISEAQAVEASVYKQIRGLMTSANSRILEIGNPLVEFGDFYEHCTNPRHGYKVMHLSCFDSPNVKAQREMIPGMVTHEYVENMKEELGAGYEDDPEWQSRVLGHFPQQSTRAWIPLSKIKSAVNRVFPEDDHLKVGGLDTAREGDDETVHCVLEGRTMIKQDCFKKVLTPQTVGWMRSLIESENLEVVAIDLGYNPGIYDDLNEMRMPVIGVNFGGESPHKKLENMGTYMWWLLREAFMHDQIGIVDDPVLVSQLSSRRVEMTPKGKTKLESKAKIKRTFTRSPDRADALAMAWYARMMLMGGLEDVGSQNIGNESSLLDSAIQSVAGDISKKITNRIHRDGASALSKEDDDIGLSSTGALDSDGLRL